MRTRNGRWLPLAVTAAALTVFGMGTVSAQPGDLLEETKARLAVEAQPVEKAVADAEREAGRIALSRPAEAAEKIRGAIALLDNDKALKPEKRDLLRRGLMNKLRQWEDAAQQRKFGPTDPVIRPGTGDRGRTEEERRREEERRKIEEVKGTVASRGGVVNDLRDLKRQQEEAMRKHALVMEKTNMPVTDDITFPPDWQEKIKRRSTRIRMTEKEKAILKVLDTVGTADFENQPLQDVLDYLQKKWGVTIVVDQAALAEAGITNTSETTVKCKIARASNRTILRKILADLGVTYIVKDEVIQVTSIARARETLSARAYYVGDLIGFTDQRFGSYVTRLQALAQLQQLAVLITQTIEPDTWMVNGKDGLGTIAFDPITMSLVVRQTADVHYKLGIGR